MLSDHTLPVFTNIHVVGHHHCTFSSISNDNEKWLLIMIHSLLHLQKSLLQVIREFPWALTLKRFLPSWFHTTGPTASYSFCPRWTQYPTHYLKKHSPEIVLFNPSQIFLIKCQHSCLKTGQFKMKTARNVEEFPRVNFPLKKNTKLLASQVYVNELH